MSDHEHLYQDTGRTEPPIPIGEGDLLWQELARTNGAILELKKSVFSGFTTFSGDITQVERRLKNLEAVGERDAADRPIRQRHVDRLLWAGLAIAALHFALQAVQLLRQRAREATAVVA